jgi:protein O-GlcNAc transferase
MNRRSQCGSSATIATVLLFGLALTSPAYSQEPSAALSKADAAYRAGLAALARRNLDEAQTDFEEVVRLAPQAEQGHSALGAVLVARGRTTEGIRQLEKALALKSSDSIAQKNLAIAYVQAGSPEKALPLFARLESSARAQKHALTPDVLAGYARALAATQQLEAAVEKMRAALAGDPRNAELHDELGSLYALRGDWPSAQPEFATAVRLKPDMAVAHMHLGLAMQAQNQSNGLEELARAEQLAPGNPTIALEYGKALAASGQDSQAIPVFRSILEREPEFIEADYQLGLALQRSGQAQDAVLLLKQVVAAQPNNAEALTNLGMALCQIQTAKDAVSVLQRSLALDPNSVTAHQDLAAAYVQLSQFDDAVRELREAIKLAPDLPQLHYNLGLALKSQDDAADAIPELETAEKLNPSAPEAPYLLGILYMQTGRYDDAAREMSWSLKLRPQNGDGWATLGSVYEKLNKLPEAVDALHEAIQQMPDQPDAHLTLASVLVKQNQPAEARAERKIAADLMRANMNRQRAEVATNSGNSLLQDGKVDEAIVQFQDALSYDPNYAEAHLGLANALDRQGKATEAALERQKAALAKTAASP